MHQLGDDTLIGRGIILQDATSFEKINKQKPHLLQLRGLIEGVLIPDHLMSVSPNKKRHNFHLQQKDVFLPYYSSRKKKGILPSNRQRKTVTTRPMKSHNTLNSVSSNGLFVYNSISKLPLSSVKEYSSSLFSGLEPSL